jgi:hypothetical protein
MRGVVGRQGETEFGALELPENPSDRKREEEEALGVMEGHDAASF